SLTIKGFMRASKSGRGRGRGQGTPMVTPPPPPPPQIDGLEEGKIELTPDWLWFSNSTVVGDVTKAWKAHYNYPYLNYKEVPLAVKDRWFNEFERGYTWRPEFNIKAREDFDAKCTDRLRDTMNKDAKIHLHKDIEFMLGDVRAAYMKRREDPEFQKRSKIGKANRLSGQTEGSFDPGHRQGSISTPMVVAKMVRNY
ncbi:hypothetical protein SOVF_048270, partial [Spinacia oleracea]